MRRVLPLLVLAILGCHRNEPVIDGKPISHWESEAKKVSLFTFWNSDKDERRRIAFTKLAHAGEPAVPTLMRLLERGNISVSGDALNALCAIGPRAVGGVPDLMKMVAESDAPAQRRSAAMVLGCIGPAASAAIPTLTAQLRSSDPRLVRVAAMALSRIGGEADESLRAALDAAPPAARASALSGVAHSGMDSARALGLIRKAMADESPQVRARGVELLMTQRDTESGVYADFLLRAMHDTSAVVRDAARGVYTYFAQRQPSPSLLALVLRKGDVDSRADAAWRLSLMMDHPVQRSLMSPQDFELVHNAMVRAQHDSVRTVRIYVVRGLAAAGKLPKPMLIGRLRHDIPNAPTDIQVRGASVLWNLTHRLEDVRNAYLAGLASDDRWLRLEALGEIMKMRTAAKPLASAIEKLRKDDPDRDVRDRATRTLELISVKPNKAG